MTGHNNSVLLEHGREVLPDVLTGGCDAKHLKHVQSSELLSASPTEFDLEYTSAPVSSTLSFFLQ